MAKKKAKKANPEFKHDWPELEGLLVSGDAVGRRKLKIMRYWCFCFMSEAQWVKALEEHGDINGAEDRVDRIRAKIKESPKGLKKYVEDLPGFGGWESFGSTWDLRGANPFFTVYRLLSLWTEWAHIMDRVAIPLDASPAEIHARVKALEQEYDESKYDSTH